ncbi:MAG TPA: polymer-forming cytoskeletal protein [Methylophilaceae bacterium]|nr:polymer-forming cytoskeletal protein [Methylophilaceae bacterium]
MLNKQGLFTRGTSTINQPANNQSAGSQSAQGRPAISPSSVSSLTGQSKSDDHFVMPGHLAAIESAHSTSTSLTPPVAETKPVVEVKAATGSRLIVGPDVKLKGAEIEDCDTLVVEGRVEATMDSRVIQIAEKGAFSGKVGIDVAEIYGKFDGELTARGQLIIHSTGRVSGKIRYGKIYIEEGGELSGDIASISIDSVKSNPSPLRSSNAGSA